MHTSAKARLTSVTIRIQICDLDCHQNLIICSLAHCHPSLKISCKSIWKFLCKVANRQTNRQTRTITHPPRWRQKLKPGLVFLCCVSLGNYSPCLTALMSAQGSGALEKIQHILTLSRCSMLCTCIISTAGVLDGWLNGL